MNTQVCRASELDAEDIGRWRELQAGDPRLQSAFLCPEVARTVARFRDDVFVLVLEDGNEIVGYLPYERHKFGVGKALLYGIADQQGVICRSDVELNRNDLLRGAGISVFEFDHLVAHQAAWFLPTSISYESSPIVDISDGYDTWLEEKRSKPKGRIKGALYKTRRLERELGTISFEYESKDPDDLDRMTEWKSLQYARTGRCDRFANSWLKHFLVEISAINEGEFSSKVSTLRAGDNILAVCLSLRAYDKLGSWFPSYDPEMSAHSPGLVSTLKLVEAAAADGVRSFDLGKGAEDYKESFKNREIYVASGWCERPSVAAYARRAQKAPSRVALNFVLEHPRLRVAARKTLNALGEARLKIRSRLAN